MRKERRKRRGGNESAIRNNGEGNLVKLIWIETIRMQKSTPNKAKHNALVLTDNGERTKMNALMKSTHKKRAVMMTSWSNFTKFKRTILRTSATTMTKVTIVKTKTMAQFRDYPEKSSLLLFINSSEGSAPEFTSDNLAANSLTLAKLEITTKSNLLINGDEAVSCSVTRYHATCNVTRGTKYLSFTFPLDEVRPVGITD